MGGRVIGTEITGCWRPSPGLSWVPSPSYTWTRAVYCKVENDTDRYIDRYIINKVNRQDERRDRHTHRRRGQAVSKRFILHMEGGREKERHVQDCRHGLLLFNLERNRL